MTESPHHGGRYERQADGSLKRVDEESGPLVGVEAVPPIGGKAAPAPAARPAGHRAHKARE